MKKIFTCILLICSMLMAACPTENDFKKAYRATEQAANYTETAAVTIGDLFAAKVITFEQKESLISKLKIVAKNLRRFHETVKAARAAYGDRLPDKEASALDIVFNREVIKPFVEILTEAGLLSESAGQQVLTALALIKSAVLLVARLFGQLRPGQSASYESIKNKELLSNV